MTKKGNKNQIIFKILSNIIQIKYYPNIIQYINIIYCKILIEGLRKLKTEIGYFLFYAHNARAVKYKKYLQ